VSSKATRDSLAECLHGAKEDEHREGGTIYPSPLGLAATWDQALVHQIGSQVFVNLRVAGCLLMPPAACTLNDPRHPRHRACRHVSLLLLQIGTEMRAKNNAELRRTNNSRMLNCFDPNINIARLVDRSAVCLHLSTWNKGPG
jgi:beta-glucosidase-like glycosyl hydrolase